MADEITRTALRGLLIPDPRITLSSLWAAQSSYTQAGPRPGVPVAQGETEMVLQSSGSQSADGALRVQVTRPGHPGTVGVVWKEDGDDDHRGWNPPYIQHHWEPVSAWKDGSGIGAYIKGSYDPHVITLTDDRVVAVWYDRYDDNVTAGDDYRVMVSTRTAAGVWSTPAAVHLTKTAPTVTRSPCLTVLPSGRVLLFFWVESPVAAQARMYYSDDAGATWTLGSRACLPTPVDTTSSSGSGNAGYDVGRLRVAYKDGQILLMAAVEVHDTDEVQVGQWAQWASSDGGGNFTQVELAPAGAEDDYVLFGAHDIVVHGGEFVVFYATTDAYSTVSSYTIAYKRLSRATQSWSATTAVDLQATTAATLVLCTAADRSGSGPGSYISDSDLAACVSPEGRLYVYTRRASSGLHECPVATSEDGDAWEWMGQGSDATTWGAWYDSGDTVSWPTSLTACYQRSRALLLHAHDSDTAGYDNSIAVSYLGGWSTVNMPGFEDSYAPERRVCWDTTWLPYDEPDDLSTWTGTTSGTAAADVDDGYLSTTTTAGTLYYTAAPTADVDEGVVFKARLQVNSAGAVGGNQVAIRLRLADSTDDYEIALRFSSTQVRLYDANAAATVDTVTVDTTGGIEVLVALAGASCRVWYREAPSSSEDQVWVLGMETDALTDDTGAPDSANLLEWGLIASSTQDVDWYEVAYVGSNSTGLTGVESLAAGQDNPDDLYPGTLSATPLHIADGVRLAAVDGPAYEGDTWNIDTRYDYAIDRIFPSVAASPRVAWKATSDQQACTIALKLSDLASTEDSRPLNDIIGLHLSGINFRQCYLQGYDPNTTSWTNIAELLASEQRLQGLDWSRSGNTVIPNSTNDDPLYVHHNEFMGGTFSVSGGSECYRITWNTAGGWTTGTTKRPTLVLDGVAGGATASGTAGQIWATSMTGIAYLDGADYSAYRLSIPSQHTVDGEGYTIGSMVLGPIEVLGTENSWGRVTETSAGTELVEADDRTSRSRVLAPPRRSVSLAWTDGIDQTQVEPSVDPAPDYILASTGGSAEPVAAIADTAYQLEGILRGLDGPHQPLVYLPYIPGGQSGPTSQILTRRSMHVLCRLASPVRVENIQGDEAADEVVRIASIELTEVV